MQRARRSERGQLRKSALLWRRGTVGSGRHLITSRLLATAEDTVTGPRSRPADIQPAVALKRKLSAVSWPFRALGTEGARERLPGPLPTLLTRCKQGPGLGEGNSWREEDLLCRRRYEKRKEMRGACVPNHLGRGGNWLDK